jgi:hypothetical protein
MTDERMSTQRINQLIPFLLVTCLVTAGPVRPRQQRSRGARTNCPRHVR